MTALLIQSLAALLILGALFVVREVQHARQVTELTNKIMAGSAREYAALKPALDPSKQKRAPQPPPGEADAQELVEAYLDGIPVVSTAEAQNAQRELVG